MVLNATFNNISVISWRSVLLVEEAGESGENNCPVAIWFMNMLFSLSELLFNKMTAKFNKKYIERIKMFI
jgi:hypothetical protein